MMPGEVEHPAEHVEDGSTDASSIGEQSLAEGCDEGDHGCGAADWPGGGEGGSGHGGTQAGQPARSELLGVRGWRKWGNVDVEVELCARGCQQKRGEGGGRREAPQEERRRTVESSGGGAQILGSRRVGE